MGRPRERHVEMKKNLGPFERVIRPLLGLLTLSVVAVQPTWGVSEGLIATAGVFLIINGLVGRCYLWKWLGIDTYNRSRCDLDQQRD